VESADLLRFTTVADVACSPDGTRIAFTVASIDAAIDDYRTAVWVANADGGEPQQLTDGPKKDSAPRWSVGRSRSSPTASASGRSSM